MIPEPSTEEVVISELHSTPLLLNAVTMADSIFSAVFCGEFPALVPWAFGTGWALTGVRGFSVSPGIIIKNLNR